MIKVHACIMIRIHAFYTPCYRQHLYLSLWGSGYLYLSICTSAFWAFVPKQQNTKKAKNPSEEHLYLALKIGSKTPRVSRCGYADNSGSNTLLTLRYLWQWSAGFAAVTARCGCASACRRSITAQCVNAQYCSVLLSTAAGPSLLSTAQYVRSRRTGGTWTNCSPECWQTRQTNEPDRRMELDCVRSSKDWTD